MRKYYVPGMITLFLLPILGFVYLKIALLSVIIGVL
ncbi:Uncharacterised protein [Myroides odoratus]|uniref:Uncharacterized protein n=1 Tax=Myroides odoratus TaxID=256 RepID=A0A378RKC1_MYROD|nr:Uncharacterised protein [Myroides odoratus]